MINGCEIHVEVNVKQDKYRSYFCFNSSPEPKAQLSYCHLSLSVVLRALCVVRRALTFYIFIFFSRTGDQISTKLDGDHPYVLGTQSCSYVACRL